MTQSFKGLNDGASKRTNVIIGNIFAFHKKLNRRALYPIQRAFLFGRFWSHTKRHNASLGVPLGTTGTGVSQPGTRGVPWNFPRVMDVNLTFFALVQ